MIKIAAAEVNGLLIKSAATIRDLHAENQDLKAQLAGKSRLEHAEKIAHIAIDRGIMSEDKALEYAQTLAESTRDLSMVEEYVAHNGGIGVPLGREEFTKSASDHTLETGNSKAESEFVDFLLTSDL